MKKIIMIGMVFLLTLPFVMGENDSIESDDTKICDYLIDKFTKEPNMKLIDAVPYKNERFNVYDMDENVVGHLILENRTIKELGCDEVNKPTYTAKVESLQTVKDIIKANDTLDTFNEKKDSDELIIKGESFTKSAKLFVTNVGLEVVSWFS